MEGDGPKGNPCAEVSPPLPARAEVIGAAGDGAGTLETHADIMGLSTGAGEPGSPEADGAPRSQGTKLCGYLQKQGGPLKAWKCRWFLYDEKECQLFYYRTAQDVTPLSRVELSSATFTYPLQGEEGTFHIQTPERIFILKAACREAKMYWLQQLQLKRLQHQSRLDVDSALPRSDARPPAGKETCPDFLPTVKTPPGLVGEEAASLPAPRLRSPLNVSIKHPLIEIQNSMYNRRQNRSSQDVSRSVFYQEFPTIPCDSPSTILPNQQSVVVPSVPSVPSSPQTPVLLVEPDPEGQRGGGSSCPSPCPTPSPRSRKPKRGCSATMPTDHKEAFSADRVSRLQQEKLSLAEEVKAQKELVWLLHKALEAAQLEKRTCAEFLEAAGEQERLELLRHGERQAADLRHRLDKQRQEAEALRRAVEERDAHLAELQDTVQLLMEKNQAKQEVILKLSEQVAASTDDPRRSVPNGMGTKTLFRQLSQENENLKDDLEAHKTQNKFLNSEIYQLTNLWRKSSQQEKGLMMKCAFLEASNCQMESRYLGVLQKLQENKALDVEQKEAVKKLIEEALQRDLKDVRNLIPNREYDEYGFKIMADYEVEDMKLLAKIQALEIRSHNLLAQEAGERSVLGRWTQYLGSRSADDLMPCPELKHLLRGGVPRQYRTQVWRWVIRVRTGPLQQRHPDRYQEMCQKSLTSPHPASRQIQLDLHRTLTTNQNFCSPTSPALQQLQRVLMAFSWQNPAIGYCQGFNRLAAIGLLVLQSEEEAFWLLVTVVEILMPPQYYNKTLLASQADQRVLKEFMAEKMPRLAAHLEGYNVDVSLITFNWFLVAFVESLPSSILLKVWDAFLYEGCKVLFRYALALFKYKEEDILKIHDSVEIYQYLRFFTKTITDDRKLTGIAFGDMNPFPRKQLRGRRAAHMERLQAELAELEALQEEYLTESTQERDKELDNGASEDDDDM